MLRRAIGSAAVGVVLAGLTLPETARAEVTRRSFDFDAGGSLVVDTDLGSIEVASRRISAVEVEVEVSGSNTEAFELSFDRSGDSLRVRGDYSRRRGGWFWDRSPRVRFRITVPERFDVDLETSGGSISVDGLEGEVRAATSGGSLDFSQVRGEIRGRTSGGSVAVDGCTGDVDVATSGGSIRLADVGGDVRGSTSGGSISVRDARGRIEVETSGGSISIDEATAEVRAETSGGNVRASFSAPPEGPSRLSTSGGSVTVAIGSGIGLDIVAHASGGRVTSDFDLDIDRSRTSARGPIHGGGPSLELRSSGGGVAIRRR